MHSVYFIFLIVSLGFTQGTAPRDAHPAIIEDVRSAESSRIVAGWPAIDGQIPHQVSLRMISSLGSVFSCGGSVIHHQWVITAAHCLANRYSFVARLGLTNVTRPAFIIQSSRKHIHPEYNEVTAGVQTADIALLGLEQSINYGPFIQPCRLQSSTQKNINYAGIILTASGYGLTDDTANGGTSSESLNWVNLRGISNEECRWWYPSSTVVRDPTICAEFFNVTAQSVCSGDSGGPITVVDYDGRPTMVGVVSFVSSTGCNSAFPSGHVRPGHYHDWFRAVTGINFDW